MIHRETAAANRIENRLAGAATDVSRRGRPTGTRRLRGMGLAAVMAFATGCGRPHPHSERLTARVELAITAAGIPVGSGNVGLIATAPEDQFGARLDAAGVATFVVAPGRYTVVFEPLESADTSSAAGRPGGAERRYPQVLSDSETSPWKIEVRAGKNRFDLAIDPVGKGG